MSTRQNRWRAKCRLEKRCQWCGKPLDSYSTKYCAVHRAADNQRQAEYYRTVRRFRSDRLGKKELAGIVALCRQFVYRNPEPEQCPARIQEK